MNPRPAGMQYLSRGLLNEDEALKIILGKHSLGGSGSSSAVETPVGSPKGKIKIYILNLQSSRSIFVQFLRYSC